MGESHPIEAHEPRLIAGSGRSGTTWVLDVVADAGDLRTVFEPLHPAALSDAVPYAQRYVPAGAPEPALESLLTRSFSGTLRSVWTDYRVRPDRLRPRLKHITSLRELNWYVARLRKLARHYRRYRPTIGRPAVLVKAIRANLMLGWVQRRFGARILLVLRHPGAVVESQLRLGGDDWSPARNLERYRGDEALMAAYGDRYRALLDEDLSPAAGLTLVWCIQNQVPLAEQADSGCGVVYYERLFTEREREWGRAFDVLGVSGEPDWSKIMRPSQQASGLSTKAGTVDASHLGRWLDAVSPSDLADIGAVLTALGVVDYAADEPLPVRVPAQTSAAEGIQ